MTPSEYRARAMMASADMALSLELLMRAETREAMVAASKRLEEDCEVWRATSEQVRQDGLSRPVAHPIAAPVPWHRRLYRWLRRWVLF